MNCGNFKKIIHDLACERMMDAAVRESALAHIESCERCAVRLADERMLTAGLKALAGLDETRQAPVALESVLQSAFRGQRKIPVDKSPSTPRFQPRWSWAWAAAVILLAFGFILYYFVQSKAKKDEVVTVPLIPSPTVEIKREQQLKPDDQIAHQNKKSPISRRPSQSKKPGRTSEFFIRDEITAYSNDPEVTSEFVSLDYGGDRTPMESGRLIRAQMPRPALVRFGLPVNVERADVPVKVDLLVGEDGMARAIRFVR